MAAESRLKKSLLNAKVNLIFYVLALILSFFSRKIFLDSLGTDFIGLIGTLQNLLGFLNLAELGVGAAIGYVLYKPIFNQDRDSINEIISVMGYVYRWVGLIILASGIILSLFLPLIFPARDTGIDYGLIFFAFYALLASSLIGYFINYRQNLLGADQKNYIVTACFQSVNMTKIIIQLLVAYKTRNPFYWVAIELVFGVVYSLILNWKIAKTYPWLKTNVGLGKKYLKKYPEVFTKSKQLFIHQINSFAQFQLTPVITYAFLSLQLVAYVGNYTILLDKIVGLTNTLFGSTTASVGNLIAEGDETKIKSVFWRIYLLRSLAGVIVIFGCLIGFNPFICAWLGSKYVLSIFIVLLLALRIYILLIAGSFYQFLYGFGLFKDVWAAITESALFIILSVSGGYFFSLPGILGGAVVSVLIIQGIWKPFFLFKDGFKTSIWNYWKRALSINGLNVIILFVGLWALKATSLTFSSNVMLALFQILIVGLIFSIFASCIYYCAFRDIRTEFKNRVHFKFS